VTSVITLKATRGLTETAPVRAGDERKDSQLRFVFGKLLSMVANLNFITGCIAFGQGKLHSQKVA